MRFTQGFFDESLCILRANGLYDALSSDAAAGVSEIFTIGHSLGGAWASILMTRIAPDQEMKCPDDVAFSTDFGISAHAVTIGKPAPFYANPDSRYDFVDRETDYVYHGDLFARSNSRAASSGCEIAFQDNCQYLMNLFNGDTKTVWILNTFVEPFALQLGQFPQAQRENIVSYSTDVDRAQGINLQFLIAAAESEGTQAVWAAGYEHGCAYAMVPWTFKQ